MEEYIAGGTCTGLLIVIRFESTRLPELRFHASLIADGIQRVQVACAYLRPARLKAMHQTKPRSPGLCIPQPASSKDTQGV